MRNRQHIHNQDGSFLLALIGVFVVSGLIVTFTAATLTGQSATQHNVTFTESYSGAEAGIQQAVTYLSQMDEDDPRTTIDHTDLPVAAGSTVGQVDFQWTAEQVAPSTWQVRSTGSRAGAERNLEALVSRDVIFYLAAFSDQSFTMVGANNVASYNAAASDTGAGAVGTNNQMTMQGSASADIVMLLGDTASCTGNGCDSGETQGFPDPYDMESLDNAIRDRMDDVCDSYVPFTTADGPLEGGNTYCFSSMTTGNHDRVDVINASSDNPAVVYVQGDVRFGGHNRINCNNPSCEISDLPDSRALQIYTTGSTFDIRQQSRIAAAIAAPNAGCSEGTSDANVRIFGSIVCNSINNQGGWRFYFDERLLGLAEGTYEIDQLREEPGNSTSFVG